MIDSGMIAKKLRKKSGTNSIHFGTAADRRKPGKLSTRRGGSTASFANSSSNIRSPFRVGCCSAQLTISLNRSPYPLSHSNALPSHPPQPQLISDQSSQIHPVASP